MTPTFDTMADLSLEQRNAALVAWLNDLTAVYEQCAAERAAHRKALAALRHTVIRMRDSGHELPASLMDETYEWEKDAARMAVAAEMGVTEWRAFLGRAALATAQEAHDA